MNKRTIIGIDLGTTNSCVSVIVGGKPRIIENREGKNITSSVVAFVEEEGKINVLIGDAAKRQAHINAENTIYSIKRIIGQDYKDIKHIADKMSYKIIADKNGKPVVIIRGKEYSPTYLVGLFLKKLVNDAVETFGESIRSKEVVITTPAHFNDEQRQATKDAGVIAGLNVVRIINEPTAAAIAYGLDKESINKILVYDLGGGTFDVTVLELDDGIFRVLATGGDNQLGGEDFDNIIMNYIISRFKEENGVDLSKSPVASYRIREACKLAKEQLSNSMGATISVPYISEGPKHIEYPISRVIFEQKILSLIERTIKITKEVLKDAGVEKVDRIVFVGGSTRIPKVEEVVKESLGMDVYKDINPDEAVAVGAALQGGIITGNVDVLLIDVTNLSLGIESMGGLMAIIIEKQTPIPTKKSKIFTTTADYQDSAVINVYQGNRKHVKNNKLLGSFKLVDIQKASRGVPQIEVSFELNASGMVKVTALDKLTNKPQNMVVDTMKISKKDLDDMVKEAEEQQEADEKLEKEVILRNENESLVHECRKQITEVKDTDKNKELNDELTTIIKPIANKTPEDNPLSQEEYENINNSLRELMSKIINNVKTNTEQTGESSPNKNQEGEQTKNTAETETDSESSDKPKT